MRIATFSNLEARHAHIRLCLRGRHHGRHDHAHGQLSIKSILESYHVGPVANKSETNVLCVVDVGANRLSRGWRSSVQPVNAVAVIVFRIQRPPNRGTAVEPYPVLDPMVLVDESFDDVGACTRLHPRRPP